MVQPLQQYSNIPSSPNSPLVLYKREKYQLIWSHYEWEQKINFETLLADYPDFFNFLRDSKLLYTLRGYQYSFQRAGTDTPDAQPFLEGIQVDQEGHPSLFKEGNWIRWENLKAEIAYCPQKKHIVSRLNSEIEWNFVHPNGLIPRSHKGYVEPVYRLNAEELVRLQQHSGATEERKCFIQVFTTESGLLKKIGHVGLRLITETGDIYSFSFLTPDNEVKLDEESAFKFLATYNVGITSPDFAEFDKFTNRRVTTIPISLEKFQNALNKVKAYTQVDLRFHYMHQNCCTFVADILDEADIPVNVHAWVGEFIWEVAKDIPILGAVVRLVDKVAKAIFQFLSYITPRFIQIPIIFSVKLIAFVPLKILTIFRNFLILSLGGAKAGASLKKGVEHKWDNRNGLTAFHTHIYGWKDIFSDEIGKISSTAEIVNWQMQQQKQQTHIHPFDGTPSFVIVPVV